MLSRCPLAARGAGMVATRRALTLAFCLPIQQHQSSTPSQPPLAREFTTSRIPKANIVDSSPDDVLASKRRTAAAAHHSSSHNIPPSYKWPATIHPTPYEIFNMPDQTAKYTKTLFYELVKLYHPDRCRLSTPHTHSHHVQNLHHDHMLLSDAIRTERFRMIVLANEILSNPRKRERYDRYGLGWVHVPSTRAEDKAYAPRGARKGYGDGSKWDASQNATWEDWERYYERTSGQNETQKPLYMSNMAFVLAVTTVCGLGGYFNLAYATGVSQGIIEEIDRQTAELADELERKRRDALAHGTKEERIRAFLALRDPVGWSVDSRSVNKPQTCMDGLEGMGDGQKGEMEELGRNRRI
ncbi:hypothetical protein BJ508DRAFT_419400 [Ascobolus immersus RN42]|uniref:J domain-containing protein n=1 Tax=Ascobolus immersus RN42 TaxID=1160509 RepID=A0A3N4HED9_ASCIM|nr:hypothetical protein BJ508DRAFT_419400 [Ascobolus immersus RN42]